MLLMTLDPAIYYASATVHTGVPTHKFSLHLHVTGHIHRESSKILKKQEEQLRKRQEGQ